jgi:fibronectin type 3 domain-containing protein
MKRFVFAITGVALLALFSGCPHPGGGGGGNGGGNNGGGTETGGTFIRFKNNDVFPVEVFSDSGRYSLLATLPAQGLSQDIPFLEGDAGFYLTYRLNMGGVTIPYNPPGSAGYLYASVAADTVTTVPIRSLLKALNLETQQATITSDVYVGIQNKSEVSLTFSRGGSLLKPLGASSSIVNAGGSALYTIGAGSASAYSFKENNIDDIAFPAAVSTFDAGKVYSFVYDGVALTLEPAEPVTLSVLSAYTDLGGGASSPDVPVPTGLNAAAVSASGIALTWNGGADSLYYIYRSEIPGGTYAFAGTAQGASFSDSGLSGNTTYYYRIRAYAGGKFSEYSAVVSARTKVPPPAGVTAESLSLSSIRITWQGVNNANGYEVWYSSTSNGNYAKLTDTAETSYTHTGLASNSTYYYKVYAKSGGETSEASAICTASTTSLQPPSSITATSVSSSRIDITWASVAEAASYTIYSSASLNGTYAQIASGVTGTSYSDTGLANGATRYYKVRAFANGGFSNYSEAANAITTVPAPTGVTATAASTSSIHIAWNEVSGAQLYYVYTAQSASGPWTQAAYVSTTSYTHSGLIAGETYYYKVKVYSGGVYSADSGVASAAPPTAGLFMGNDQTYISGVAQPFSIAKALAWLKTNAQANTAYTITINANENLAPQTLSTANLNGKTGVSITVKGYASERTVQLSANGSIFTIASGVTLTLEENVTLLGRASNSASLITVNSGGTLVMEDGAKVRGNTATGSGKGGGVSISSGGTFTMNGGEITANTVDSTDTGGGVMVDGGGSFLMNGGTISANSTSSGYSGAGVFVNLTGTFTMNSGEIFGNTNTCVSGAYGAGSSGGGVTLDDSATFTMNGGTVYGSTATGVSTDLANSAMSGAGAALCRGSYTTARFGLSGGHIGSTAAGTNGVLPSHTDETITAP